MSSSTTAYIADPSIWSHGSVHREVAERSRGVGGTPLIADGCLPRGPLCGDPRNYETGALSPRPSPRRWEEEAKCLAEALSSVLSPFAYTFLVAYTTARIEERAAVAGLPVPAAAVRRHAKDRRWLSLDVLAEERRVGEPDDRVWFVGDMSEQYRQEAAEATRQREALARWEADYAREKAGEEARNQQLLQQQRAEEIGAEKERQQRAFLSEEKKAKAARAKEEREAREVEERYKEQLAIREQ